MAYSFIPNKLFRSKSLSRFKSLSKSLSLLSKSNIVIIESLLIISLVFKAFILCFFIFRSPFLFLFSILNTLILNLALIKALLILRFSSSTYLGRNS